MLDRGLHFPVGQDSYFKDYMTPWDRYHHYHNQHYDHHPTATEAGWVAGDMPRLLGADHR